MPNLEIKHLFTYSRFSEKYDILLYTLLYFPFGLILFILRSILALSILLLGVVLPNTPVVQKIINKITCLSFGVSVNVENPNEIEDVKVYISNSLSIFDSVAVVTAVGAVSPGPEVNPIFAKALGTHYFGNPSSLANFRKSVISYMNEKGNPVCFTPEGRSTNGRGLLKFKSYPFSFSDEVQPVVIQIKRPFLAMSVTTLGAGYWADVFFYMMSPFTIYNLRFLPIQARNSMSDEEYAESVRQILTQKMGVPLLDFTVAEMNEWEKRKIIEQSRVRSVPEPNRLLKLQALQVKEVLPHVPLNVIYEDLSRTRSVDNTISNILEGHISFVPEPVRQPSPRRSSASSSASSSGHSSPSSTASVVSGTQTFPKSAQERNRTFQERKEQLISNARRRYIEKHNLDIPF